jgi:hypothetical protein
LPLSLSIRSASSLPLSAWLVIKMASSQMAGVLVPQAQATDISK